MEERTLPRYPAGKRELIFGLLVLLFGTFTWNSILYGGFCLGFALGAVALTGCSFGICFAAASGRGSMRRR